MIIKEIEFNQEKLMSGIKKISDAVSSTLGPMGRTVLIESENHTRGITVTKDGVTVAKSIILEDPIENLAVTMIKEASEKTATAAGDGTTTRNHRRIYRRGRSKQSSDLKRYRHRV